MPIATVQRGRWQVAFRGCLKLKWDESSGVWPEEGASTHTQEENQDGSNLGQEMPNSRSIPKKEQDSVRGSRTQNLQTAQEWLDRAVCQAAVRRGQVQSLRDGSEGTAAAAPWPLPLLPPLSWGKKKILYTYCPTHLFFPKKVLGQKLPLHGRL